MRATIGTAVFAALMMFGEVVSAAYTPPRPAPKPSMDRDQAQSLLDEEQRLVDGDALTHSAAIHDVRLVEALLLLGVDANARGILPQSALALVVTTQCQEPPHGRDAQLRIIDLLIAHGAKGKDHSFGDSDLLIWAAQQCPPAVVERLLAAGAELEARSPQGFSPLSMALAVRNLDTAEFLIEQGARIKPETVTRLFSDAGGDARLADLVKRASGPAVRK